MTTVRPAFEATFQCGNCGREWAETFYQGDRITEHYGNAPWLESRDCTHRAACESCRRIECRNCGLSKDVRLQKRKPLISPEEGKSDG